jgi:flagellar biosynthetic protein FliP
MTIRTGILVLTLLLPTAVGGAAEPSPEVLDIPKLLPELTSPEGLSTGLKWLLAITFLSLAPAIVIMVTCFTRIIIVLGLLRQALTTPGVPPNQVLFGLAIFMTLVVMAPVYTAVYTDAIQPYLAGRLGSEEALEVGTQHIRNFLVRQIEGAGNTEDVYLFLDEKTAAKENLIWSDVPIFSLIPAFVVSELKVAFMMGFRIFLPFVIIDMLVASVLVSTGVLMLPPVLISLPFKLLLFVLADGWTRVVGSLMRSFG